MLIIIMIQLSNKMHIYQFLNLFRYYLFNIEFFFNISSHCRLFPKLIDLDSSRVYYGRNFNIKFSNIYNNC